MEGKGSEGKGKLRKWMGREDDGMEVKGRER